MQAIIMAGGEGERLRPLTCTLPKPLTLFMERPILSYTLDLLKAHGIEEAGITLGYLPDAIPEAFGDGSEYGVSLRYFIEQKPLGTAGGVKLAADFLKETFFVLSGDGITDVDLTEAMLFHRKKKALATIVLKKVSSPTEYGLVTLTADGRVTGFVEKPSWSRVTGDLANTGIYILEPEVLSLIPEGQSCDFGQELFPLLLEKGERVFGYETERYWCDIGDISAYLKAHEDALQGQFSLIKMPENGILRLPGAIVEDDVVIEKPAFIGANARLHHGARILPGSVIGSGAVIGPEASVKKSIVYPHAVVQAHAELRGAVIAGKSNIGPHSQVFEECVIGAESALEGHVCVKPGVKIWPGKQVGAGTTLYDNLVWGQRHRSGFSGDGIPVASPAEAILAAQALAWKLKFRTVLVGRSASSVAAAQERAVVSGLTAQGVQVYTTGESTLPQLRFLVGNMGLAAGVFVQSDALTPFMSDGTPLLAAEKRRVEGALLRQDMPLPYSGITHPIVNAGRGDLSYLGFLRSAVSGKIRRLSAAVYAQNNSLLYLAENAFQNAGINVRAEWEEELMELDGSEIGVYLWENGEKVHFASSKGILSDPQNELLIAWAMARRGEKELLVPGNATHALPEFCESLGVRCRVSDEPDDRYLRSLHGFSPYQFHMRMDGIFCALSVVSQLNEDALSVDKFISQLPDIARVEKEVEIPFAGRGQAIRRFRELLPKEFEEENLCLRSDRGCAWLRPLEDRPVCTVISEARDTEFAAEICETLAELLEKAMENA